MRASGPVAIRTGTLIRKTGCRGPLGTVAARCVIRWNRGKPYLLRTFFIRSEEALASANWPKPGSMEARLALMIWLKVSFFMMFPFGRPPVFLLLSSSASCGASLLVVFLSLYLLLFFCCAFTIGRKVCVRHAAIAISIVDSSVHLKERIKNGHIFCCAACRSVVSSRKVNGFLLISTLAARFASFQAEEVRLVCRSQRERQTLRRFEWKDQWISVGLDVDGLGLFCTSGD